MVQYYLPELPLKKDQIANIAIDKNGKIAIDWGVYGIPETFVVNSEGIIKYRYVGPINQKIYRKINLLIKELEKL